MTNTTDLGRIILQTINSMIVRAMLVLLAILLALILAAAGEIDWVNKLDYIPIILPYITENYVSLGVYASGLLCFICMCGFIRFSWNRWGWFGVYFFAYAAFTLLAASKAPARSISDEILEPPHFYLFAMHSSSTGLAPLLGFSHLWWTAPIAIAACLSLPNLWICWTRRMEQSQQS